MPIRRLLMIAALAALGGYAVLRVVKIGRQSDGAYLLPTGQYITPTGEHIEVNDRPLGMTLSPDGGTLAVVTGSNFNPRALHLIDARQRKLAQTVPIGDSFAGVAFSPDGKTLYVGGGQNHDIKIFRRSDTGSFAPEASIGIAGSAPSGIALSSDGKTLVAALNLKHAVAIVDTASRSVGQVAVSNYPYTVVLSSDGKHAYVSNWGGRRPRPEDKVDPTFPIVVDPRTGIPSSGTISIVDIAARRVVREIEVGLHPCGMVLHGGTNRLYVANANSDSVTVLDTHTNNVLGSVNVRPFANAPIGSSPNALAITKDGKTLYVANAANNAVAVVDVSQPSGQVRGFIPAGWYPTAVTLSADQRSVFIASGYGFGSNAPAANGSSGRSYKDRKGVVSIASVPQVDQLRRMSGEVARNNHSNQPWTTKPASPANPVPMNLSETSPIEHVFYVIKENRTYDQVFGDLAQGNGDASLVHFGREVTPNHHALVEQFVLLDNFYAPGDQSALGHRWCTQGYASDWLHKYGNARNDTNPMLYAPSDFLWDNAKAHGVSVRSYGERGQVKLTPANATWTDVYRDWKEKTGRIQMAATTPILGLRDVYSPTYPGFSMTIPDQVRVDKFLVDFQKFEQDGSLPRLTILLLPTDHTDGTAPGFPTPRAMVADNDLALGRLVEVISKSRYWSKSVIFVVEDDAQNGLDHVDGHRTVALVIGPHVRRKVVDSTFYTTINMYRTIEQILGLPPSNQFDLAAEPMFSVFTTKPDNAAYQALPNRIPLDEMNPSMKALRGLERELAIASSAMDFDEPDAAPEDELNRAIWHSVMGFAKPYPR